MEGESVQLINVGFIHWVVGILIPVQLVFPERWDSCFSFPAERFSLRTEFSVFPFTLYKAVISYLFW
jgi:hypothetical protein